MVGTQRRNMRPRPRFKPVVAIVLVVLALVAVVLVALRLSGSAPAPGAGIVPPDSRADPDFVAYTKDSFFRKPLPDTAPLDPLSDQGIAYIKQTDKSQFPVIRGVDGNEWGMPFALATCADPVWKLTGDVPDEVSYLRTDGFHAPASIVKQLTLTSDSPMVVIDRCGTLAMPNGLTVWAANVSGKSADTLRVTAAGAFQHDSNGLDRRDPLSSSALNFRSRGAIPDAMVIRNDLLSRGMATHTDLGHVLHMFWFETDTSAGFVHPMVGDESDKYGFGAEGMRIRIKPGVDIATRNCTPAGLVVARTLQRYGAYLGDNSGGATSLKAQQGSNLITADALSCLTWDDFEFVQRGWDG